jgi:hypothetical protein
VLHAVGHAFQDGTTINLAGWDRSRAKNLFAGHTVYSIVLEVPDRELLADAGDNRKIGVWAVSTLATDSGGWRSINRVGLPMIHPLFTQYNEDLGNRLNAGRPADDLATHGTTVAKAIAGVVAAYGTADDPQAYGENVARRFCPNLLPYEVGTPASFGFLQWNGRTMIDNAPDVMFSLAANTPVTLGIGKESVTSKPSKNFPYVPAPKRASNAMKRDVNRLPNDSRLALRSNQPHVFPLFHSASNPISDKVEAHRSGSETELWPTKSKKKPHHAPPSNSFKTAKSSA